MKDYPKKTIDYFRTLYTSNDSAWGASVSDLAKEAAALLKTTCTKQNPRVLDLGCGDGRDSLFFALHGCDVTSVDYCDEGLKNLSEKAAEMGVGSRVSTICANMADFEIDDEYDLIFSNYTLHFLNTKQRARLIENVKEHTAANGYNAVLALKDLNEEYVGDLRDYNYLSTCELADSYHDWDEVDVYNGLYPDEHPGYSKHYHSVSIIIAQKPAKPTRTIYHRVRGHLRNAAVCLCVVAISVLLCTLGYSSLNSVTGSIAKVWPGAIFQVVAAIALGGWGILATIVAGLITNAINVKSFYAILVFTPANFIQSFIPAYYYRRVLKNGGWNSKTFRFLPFLIFGVLIPNIFGAAMGAIGVYVWKGVPFDQVFVKWLIANIPIAILLGWPLLRTLVPQLADEGWTVRGWWK